MMKEAAQLQQCREIAESRPKGKTLKSLSYRINNTLIDDSDILSPSNKEISLTHSDEYPQTASPARSFSKIPRMLPRTLSCPTYANTLWTEHEKN